MAIDKAILSKWNTDRGDQTHRLNYDLDENSVVIDAGGYKGEWAQNIYNRYKCNVYIFEPVDSFYNQIVNKFKNNDKVRVFKYGLAGGDKEVKINLSEDSSSIHKSDGKSETIQLKSLVEFLNNNNIDNVDLIKINIEGGEFELLKDVIEKGKQTSFKNIQVQFHSFIDGSKEMRDEIRESLAKTHKETYSYEFIWENWNLK